jgi:hypothetical protein
MSTDPIGHALGGAGEGPRVVLADVLAIFGTDAGLQWADVASRLASRFPARWDGASADAISAECRALGGAQRRCQVRRQGAQGLPSRRRRDARGCLMTPPASRAAATVPDLRGRRAAATAATGAPALACAVAAGGAWRGGRVPVTPWGRGC